MQIEEILDVKRNDKRQISNWKNMERRRIKIKKVNHKFKRPKSWTMAETRISEQYPTITYKEIREAGE